MSDRYRPAFHFTPPSMWLNDPNGLVYYDGEYHLFYQYHPHSTIWGPMHWGHAVSRNLLTWEHLPIALYPDDNGMIFSGSAVVDVNNTARFGKDALVDVFTYNKDGHETQNLAYSADRGRTWTKYPDNPVISYRADLKDCRDPKVFWHCDHWVMVLAAGDHVLFYISSDLKTWEQSGSFGHGYGSTSGVWETPDLFQLPINGSDSRWVLTVGVGDGACAGGSGTQYFIGSFDGKTFTSQNAKDAVLWMDYGADFYAPQSWNNEPNGRRIVIGWMSNWQYARETPAETWRGMFSLPREVSLLHTQAGLRLAQQPVAELQTLRREAHRWRNRWVSPGQNLARALQTDAFELTAEVDIPSSSGIFGFHVRKGANEQTTITCNLQTGEILLDRTRSGYSQFAKDFAAVHAAKLYLEHNILRIRIFVDRCSVEVFAEDGLVCFSELIYPSTESRQCECFAKEGRVYFRSLAIHYLNGQQVMKKSQFDPIEFKAVL